MLKTRMEKITKEAAIKKMAEDFQSQIVNLRWHNLNDVRNKIRSRLDDMVDYEEAREIFMEEYNAAMA